MGLAGESQNFDGNGTYTRFQTGGGSQTVCRPAPSAAPAARCSPTRSAPPLGTRPARPARKPPYNRDRPAATTRGVPDLNGARIGGGP